MIAVWIRMLKYPMDDATTAGERASVLRVVALGRVIIAKEKGIMVVVAAGCDVIGAIMEDVCAAMEAGGANPVEAAAKIRGGIFSAGNLKEGVIRISDYNIFIL